MLNHAAALLVFLLSFALAGAATALDGIDLNEPLEPVAEGECPRLIQIKYPFLSCADGQIGQSDSNETWDNSRHMPMGRSFVEGNGYWGPTLNTEGDAFWNPTLGPEGDGSVGPRPDTY